MKDDTARDMYLRRLRTLMDQELQSLGDAPVTPGLTLTVDPTTGQLAIQNYSLETIKLQGYAIRSAFGNLNPNTWHSLSDQGLSGWDESNPSNTFLGELNLENNLTMVPGQVYTLGYSAGILIGELSLTYALDGSTQTIIGSTIYDELPINEPGDWITNHEDEFGQPTNTDEF